MITTKDAEAGTLKLYSLCFLLDFGFVYSRVHFKSLFESCSLLSDFLICAGRLKRLHYRIVYSGITYLTVLWHGNEPTRPVANRVLNCVLYFKHHKHLFLLKIDLATVQIPLAVN